MSPSVSPWFSDPTLFGALYGGISGAVLGIACGVLGAVAGILAPKGKGRPFVLGGILVLLIYGMLNLGVGIVALLVGQPYSIWYPFLLLGTIGSFVIGFVYPIVRNAYHQAETRKLDAAALRNS